MIAVEMITVESFGAASKPAHSEYQGDKGNR